jgi:hypothetical protein
MSRKAEETAAILKALCRGMLGPRTDSVLAKPVSVLLRSVGKRNPSK